jgi:hypothetical protein
MPLDNNLPLKAASVLVSVHRAISPLNNNLPLKFRKKTTFLVPPFPFVKEDKGKEDKDKDEKPKATDAIKLLMKQRADSNATASTYTLKVKGFAKGLLKNGLNSVKEFPKSGGRTA